MNTWPDNYEQVDYLGPAILSPDHPHQDIYETDKVCIAYILQISEPRCCHAGNHPGTLHLSLWTACYDSTCLGSHGTIASPILARPYT